MLDVHPPHHRLEGIKDFVIHLLTITAGLLIAVGIEGCVERHHQHDLAIEARETLHKEIEQNAKKMADDVTDLTAEEAKVKDGIAVVIRLAEHPKDKNQHGTVAVNYSIKEWDSTAWTTAQTTGALAFMPYDEANKYSRIYDAQHSVSMAQEKLAEDVAQFSGAIYRSGIGGDDFTSEKAGLLLERLGIMQTHLATLKGIAMEAAATDKAFLEGKETSFNYHEDIKY
jgi:hypothetical protein